MADKIFSRRYFARPTVQVARSLIGKYLVRVIDGRILAGKIVEVEAYVDLRIGPAMRRKGDAADGCHVWSGGVAYVYLIYGMYHCLNVVTEREEFPAAVLIRAIEMDGELIEGPGRLCRALQIDRCLNRVDLTAGESIWFEDQGSGGERGCGVPPRVGVDYVGEWRRNPGDSARTVTAPPGQGAQKNREVPIGPAPPCCFSLNGSTIRSFDHQRSS